MEDQNTTQQNVVVSSLYSLLESAKLCDYYDRFLQQGGDDIDQLCEATDHEFKEITKLVGMHTKPLHIRRLQKALVEFWSEKKRTGKKPRPNSLGPSWIDTWNTGQSSQTKSHISLTKPTTTTITITTANCSVNEPSSSTSKRGRPCKNQKKMKRGVFELKLPAMEAIIDWESLDEERKQLIREHSRIYGRDTKKRKCIDLNGHEQMINEAAAQLCLRDPTLLVRRDELFTQARRIVRDSGFLFVHGHSRSKFANDSVAETMVDKTDLFKSGSKTNRQERIQEVEAMVAKLKEKQDMLTRKKREFETTNQSTGDLQQELNNVQYQINKLQTEQTQLQKKQRRSDRYYNSKEATRRSTLSVNDNPETEVQMDEMPSGDVAEEQHSVVVTEMLQNVDDSNSHEDHNSASEDPTGAQTLFIIPQGSQQHLTEGIPTDSSVSFQTIRTSGATLDQTTINTLLNLANEEKSNNNGQALQNFLGQIGLPSNQTAQQLISQIMAATSPEQTNITQEQQQYMQQPSMTVVEHLATSSSPAVLGSSSHDVVTSLQDSSHMVQYD